MFVFIKFARQSNFNLYKCLFVCFYVIIIIKGSEYLVTDKVKFSGTVKANYNDLHVKTGNFVNNDTVKQNNYVTNSKLNDSIKSPLQCKLMRQIYICHIKYKCRQLQ